jgi:hypothetical protein
MKKLLLLITIFYISSHLVSANSSVQENSKATKPVNSRLIESRNLSILGVDQGYKKLESKLLQQSLAARKRHKESVDLIKQSINNSKLAVISPRKAQRLIGVYNVEWDDDLGEILEIRSVDTRVADVISFTYDIYDLNGFLVVADQIGLIVEGNMIFHSPTVDVHLSYLLKPVITKNIIGASGLVNFSDASVVCDEEGAEPIFSNIYQSTMTCGWLFAENIPQNNFSGAAIYKVN